jgi:hypothetical protein
MNKILASTVTLLLLSGCVTTSAQPGVAAVWPEGSSVAIDQPVAVADLSLTPLRVIEDSRCPINARCAWAGRIVVETLVAGTGWGEVLPLELGEPAGTHGYVLNLVSAEPGQMAGADPVKPGDYRFAFEGQSPDHPLE